MYRIRIVALIIIIIIIHQLSTEVWHAIRTQAFHSLLSWAVFSVCWYESRLRLMQSTFWYHRSRIRLGLPCDRI